MNETKWMTNLCVILFCFLHLFSLSVLGNDAPVLSEVDFEKELLDHDNLLVLFTRFNVDCAECGAAVDVVDLFVEGDPECGVAIVDCTDSQELCDKYDLTTTPSLLFFSESLAIYPYKNPFIFLEGVRKFVAKYSEPKFRIFKSVDEIDSFVQTKQVTVVGFFASDQEDNKATGSFRRTAAEQFVDYSFVEVPIEGGKEDSILAKYGVELDSVVMFKLVKGSLEQISFPGEISRRKLANWVNENAPWIVHEIEGTDVSSLIERYRLPLLTVYLDYLLVEVKNQIISEITLAAQSFRGQILFTYIDGNTILEEDLLKRWGNGMGTLPLMLLAKPGTKDVYSYSGNEINQKSIEKFCQDYLKGRLHPHIIKQVAPENNSEPTRVLVHDNYREIVHDKSKDVVVLFYLPEDECRHCPAFVNIFEQVAQSLADLPDLVFGKLDLHANPQVPSVRVFNFPSVRMYTMGSKFREANYSGPRTVDDLVKWVKEHLTHNLGELNGSLQEDVVH